MMLRWMIATCVFTLCLTVAGAALEWVLRTFRRESRFVWLSVLLTSLVWCVVAPFVFVEQPVAVAQAPLLLGTPLMLPAAIELSDAAPAVSITLTDVLLAAWLLLTIVLLVQLAAAVRVIMRVRRNARRTELDGTPVLMTDSVGPAVVGAHAPDIIIPQWLLELDTPLRVLVLEHERQHRDARDPLLLWMAAIATALLPWNVALWFVSRRLRLAVEIDCDHRTLRHTADPQRYAHLLMLIAQRSTHLRSSAMLVGSPSNLSRRITAMANVRNRFTRTRVAVGVVAATVAVAAACATRIPGNITAPNATPSAATVVTDAPVEVEVTKAPAAQPYFDFQVELPATVVADSRAKIAPLLAGLTNLDVVVQFVVNEQGVVQPNTIKVLRTNIAEHADIVRKAVEGLTFTPAKVQGKAVSQLVQLPFISADRREVIEERRAAAPTTAPARRVNEAAKVADPSKTYFDYQVDKPAMGAKGNVAPQYPEALRASRTEGMVLVQFVVNADGSVEAGTFRILRTSHQEFADAIESVLPKMKFEPATVGGQPVRQLVQQPFVFSLSR